MSVLPSRRGRRGRHRARPADPRRRRGGCRLPAPPGRHARRRLAGLRWSSPSFTAPLWRPYEVDEQDLANRLALPSAAHWLGTDPLGRDLLSRIFTAGAQPLLVSALTVLVAFGIGIPLALMAAERGRRVERVTSRLTEVLMALPGDDPPAGRHRRHRRQDSTWSWRSSAC